MRLLIRKLLRLRILHDLRPDHQTLAADIADDRILLLHLLQAFHHVRSLFRRILQQVLVPDDVDHLQRRRTRHGIPAERVSVRPTLPVHQLLLRNGRADRKTRSQRLRRADNIRLHTPVLNPKPAPRPAHTRLDLIIHHHNPILVQQLLQPHKIIVRRDNIAPLALDRLYEHCRHILGRQVLVQDLFLDEVDTVHATLGIAKLERTTVTVSKRHVSIARDHREEVPPLVRLASRQTQGAQGPAMKRADEGEERVLPSMPLSQLHRRLYRLRPTIAEEDLLPKTPRRNPGQFLRQLDNLLVVKIRPRVMDQLLSLLLDRGHNPRMRMADRETDESRVEIDKLVPINIPDNTPMTTLSHKRIESDQRLGNDRLILLD